VRTWPTDWGPLRWVQAAVVATVAAASFSGALGGGRYELRALHTSIAYFPERTVMVHQLVADAGFGTIGNVQRPITTDFGTPIGDANPTGGLAFPKDLDRFHPAPQFDGEETSVVLGAVGGRGVDEAWARHWVRGTATTGTEIDAVVLIADDEDVTPLATVAVSGVRLADIVCVVEQRSFDVEATAAPDVGCRVFATDWGARLEVVDLPPGTAVRLRAVISEVTSPTNPTSLHPAQYALQPAPPRLLVAAVGAHLALLSWWAAAGMSRRWSAPRGRIGVVGSLAVAFVLLLGAWAVASGWSRAWAVGLLLVIGFPAVVAAVMVTGGVAARRSSR
jgi:hypothetical protein